MTTRSDNSPLLFTEYLSFLGVSAKKPGLNALRELVAAQMVRVPFENISKLYWRHETGLASLPGLDKYLRGIRDYNFGGTCYTNASYFHLLLAHLGYDVKLCGASMSQPDVHLVNIVTLDNRDYLIDVGYAAPFLEPLPLFSPTDFEITQGSGRYILRPRDHNSWSRMDFLEGDRVTHGYSINPRARRIEEFRAVVADSFTEQSTFMNALLLVKFAPDRIVRLKNLTLTVYSGDNVSLSEIPSRSDLPKLIEQQFGIPARISGPVIERMGPFRDD